MRFFIRLSYDGGAYHGWQIQPNGTSVEEVIESRLSLLIGRPTDIVGAGRTDTGVNASMMMAHFDCDTLPGKFAEGKCNTTGDSTQSEETASASFCMWLSERLNRMLPPDISVQWVRRVRDDAHARFSALSRTYHYYICHTKSPFRRAYTCRIDRNLDYDAMNAACKELFKYIDFTSFSKLHTDTKTNNCTIMEAKWTREDDDCWKFTIKANRFLRNMVRAIVGTLVDVGLGKLDIEGFRHVIEGKNRCKAGMSMPGNALFLADIEYPEDIYA